MDVAVNEPANEFAFDTGNTLKRVGWMGGGNAINRVLRGRRAIHWPVGLIQAGALGEQSADRQDHTTYLPLNEGPSPGLTPAVCTEVSDGDSIWVDLDGDGDSDERVRYLLVDTPERGECYYDEARERSIELVYGETIGLEMDIEDRDSYDRLLRYVWVDGQDVGGVLLREGYGRVEGIRHGNVMYLPEYLGFQEQAIAEVTGIWGVCDYPTPTPIPTVR